MEFPGEHGRCFLETRARTAHPAIVWIITFVAIFGSQCAQSQTFTTLHSFGGSPDGAIPYGNLFQDEVGNLYGTTELGGLFSLGTIFKLDRTGRESVLHSFAGYPIDGASPFAGLTLDNQANLYGTTAGGGVSNGGTIFKLDRSGNESVLHSFGASQGDGSSPYERLVLDMMGNIYGTTYWGGQFGYGTVFELDRSGVETVLHSFGAEVAHGSNPYSSLLRDRVGNLIGTTLNSVSAGAGTVFKLDRSGQETVVYGFNGGEDGASPQAGLIRGKAGNLYGTTMSGGDAACSCGTVFRIDVSGRETVLHRFTGGTDGAYPQAGVILDPTGNLYGTTAFGGDPVCGCGTLFRVDSSGIETVLYRFTGGMDGGYPRSSLIRDAAGNLYGTTSNNGANGSGTVFRLRP